MAVVGDGDADRMRHAISDKHACPDPATLLRWVGELLEDRRARTSVILGLCRRARHVRQRLDQAHRYFAGLVDELEGAARAPWAGKVLCPVCGAPIVQAGAAYRPDDPRHHVPQYHHADGTVCEERPKTSAASRV